MCRALESFYRETESKEKYFFKDVIIKVFNSVIDCTNILLEQKIDKQKKIEEYANKIRDYRNDFTHANHPWETRNLKCLDILDLTEKITIIMTCAILRHLGFRREKIKQLMDNTRLYPKYKNYNKENEENIGHNFDFNLICEYFAGLERQGPGSPESTIKALSFIDNLTKESKILDLGCGTGGQTIILAKNTNGNITGVDHFPGFIDIFNSNAKKLNLQDRMEGIVCSMDNLPFNNDEFDLIWSEGAIANIGFEKGLNYWKGFLKKNGYIAVTYESWFTNKRPAEIEKWWLNAVPETSTIGQNILIMQKAGYLPVAAFTLPENCWLKNYFISQKARQEEFLKKYAGNKTIEDLIGFMRHEEELYSKYKRYYGYVFYIGKRI